MAHNPFHGLMQPGQRPSMQFQQLNQAYQSDPQGAFAAQQAGQANAFNQAMASRSADLGGLFGLAGNLGAAYLLR